MKGINQIPPLGKIQAFLEKLLIQLFSFVVIKCSCIVVTLGENLLLPVMTAGTASFRLRACFEFWPCRKVLILTSCF